MNITVMSYAESVDFGVIACERSVPQVAEIAHGFGTAVAELLEAALEKEDGESAVDTAHAGNSAGTVN